VQGSLGPLGAGLNLMGTTMKGVGQAAKFIPEIGAVLGPVIEALSAIPGLIGSITESLTSMAGKASPGTVRQLSIAMEDFQATVGQAFLPVVELMTQVTRDLGDIVANVVPDLSEVQDALGPVRDAWNDLKVALKEIAPLLHDLFVVQMKLWGTELAVVIEQVAFMTRALVELADAFGLIDHSRQEKTRTAAARPATLGSIEEYQRRLQLETASAGRGGGPESVPGNVATMVTMMREIHKWIKKLTEPQHWKDIIRAAVVPGAKDVGDTVREGESSFNLASLFVPGSGLAGAAALYRQLGR
jgi:hypothetical protein